jgi:hypothetical protein
MAKKKAKQEDLPGVDGPGVGAVRIQAVDEAACEYVKWRDKRMDLTKKEVDAKKALIAVMHENETQIGRAPDGGMVYIYEEVQVALTPTGEQLKVTAYVDPGEPE